MSKNNITVVVASILIVTPILLLVFISDSGENNKQTDDSVKPIIEDPANTADTSTWIELLTRTTGASYLSGQSVCTNLRQSHRERKDGAAPNVYVTAADEKTRFMDYRYTVLLDNQSNIKDQLAAFQKAGFLTAKTTMHEDRPAIEYQLTSEGWGGLSRRTSYGGTLCYSTGQWAITRILDYQLLDDQESGLDAYNVKYEIEYLKENWATPNILKAFNNKRKSRLTAKQSHVVLVKGPTGYYNTTPARNRSTFQLSPLPTKEEALKIFYNSHKFIANLCQIDRITLNPRDVSAATTSCDISDQKKPKETFKIYNVEIPSGGNMIKFKFSYTNYKDMQRYGEGTITKDQNNEWIIDSSFSLISPN